MTESANVATLTFPDFSIGMSDTAKKEFDEYTRADGSSMEVKLLSAGEVEREWRKHQVGGFGFDAIPTYQQWFRLSRAAESPKTRTVTRIPHAGMTGGNVVHGPGNWLWEEQFFGFQVDEVATAAPQASGDAILDELMLINVQLAALRQAYAGDLQEALAELETLSEAARMEEVPEPDADAVANARILLPKLFALLPVRYRLSPTERRGVAIDAPMRWGASVAVECAPDDTVYCFATIGGNSRRAKFYQMDGLPDVFIAKALRDLAAG